MEVTNAISSQVSTQRVTKTAPSYENKREENSEKYPEENNASNIANASEICVDKEMQLSGCPFASYHIIHLDEAFEQNEEKDASKELADESSRIELLNLLRNTKGDNIPDGIEVWSYREIIDWMIEGGGELLNIPEELRFLVPAVIRKGDCGRGFLDKPEWLDLESFRRGQKFAMDNFFGLCYANMLSLCIIFSDMDGLLPMILSGKSHTPYLSFQRYLSTVQRVRSWYVEDPWTESSHAYKNLRTVRQMHLAVRKRLCESTREEIRIASEIPDPWCTIRKPFLEDIRSSECAQIPDAFQFLKNAPYRPKGLNQADMSVTQFAFMGLITSYPRFFGVHHSSEEDMEAFCHLWRTLGYLLGIEDEYNFCRGNLSEIRKRSAVLIEKVFKPKLCDVQPEWEHMTRCIVEGTSYYLQGLKYNGVLLSLSDLLEIPTLRLRATMSYLQRLKHVINRWLFYYVMWIPGVTTRLNSFVHKNIDRAAHFDTEKHAALKEKSNKTMLNQRSGTCDNNQRLIRQADR